MSERITKVAICPVCHSQDIEDADSRCWRCNECRQWFLKKGERIMSEIKPKRREIDELYTLLIAALHNMVKQVTEIYDLDFGTVIVHLEEVEHGY